jgi:hypothetical protein
VRVFRRGVGALLLTDAKDLTDALLGGLGERGIVFMRRDGSENASGLKSYGRFLRRFYVWLMGDPFSVF